MDQSRAPVAAITVRLLGGAAIEEAGEPLGGRAAHRHALGLLALLSTSPSHTVSRDKLVAMLWPDADPAGVRHRLNVALHDLRKTLGRDAILSKGDDLRLDPDVVPVDVALFDDAVRRGDAAAAVELHRGPFLDGFHLPDAGEFDEWASVERERLARALARSLETLAEEAEAAGDPVLAARWWRRLARVDLYAARPTLRLMGALAAAGERAEALRVAGRHVRSLEEDLGAAADPAVEALAERIREGEGSPREVAVDGAWSREPESAPPKRGLPPERGSPPEDEADARRDQPRRWLVGGAAAAGAMLLLALPWLPGGGTADEPVPDRVVVLPFTVRGGADFAYLGDGMAEILAATLDGVGALRTADPHAVLAFVDANGLDRTDPDAGQRAAERFGAGRFVLGSIVESGRRIHVQATLYRADGSIEARSAAGAGTDAEFFDMVDDLTRRLLVPRFDPDEERQTRLAVTTSASLAALKAYLEGEARLRAGEYEPALEAYRRATREDSTFALAWSRLAVAAEWAFLPHDAAIAVKRAVALAERLPERDRLLLVGWDAYARGEADRAEAVYERVLDDWPEEVMAWLQLGEIRFHYAPSRGRTIADSRAAFERVLELDPAQEGARLHLARVAALEGERAELDAHVRRIVRRDRWSQAAYEARGLRALAAGDTLAMRELAEDLGGEDSYVALGVMMGQFHVGNVPGVEWGARSLTTPRRPPEVRTAGWTVAALARLAGGRLAAADSAIARAEALDPLRGGELRVLAATLPFLPDDPADLRTAREALDRGEGRVADSSFFLPDHDGVRPVFRTYLRGLVAAGQGDSAGALRRAAELERMEAPAADRSLPGDLARGVRAEVHRRAGRTARALAELDAIEEPAGYELVLPSPFHPRVRERYLRARLLEEVGREAEARAVYAATGNRSVYDLPYRAPVAGRLGPLLERTGDRGAALHHWARLATLYQAAEPGLRPWTVEARRALARLEARE